MGKPASSCFKIIGCGSSSDAVDNDDLAPEEAKASADKRMWSFRKRLSKHQVLCNNVISEPLSVCSSKENQDVSAANFHSPNFSFPERTQEQEKSIGISPVPTEIVNTESPVSKSCTTPVGPTLNESDAVVIQAAIRGYMAKKNLHKLESVVKLQAAVRGHLVRSQAIGTLRCIQAIIRMQALVRAHHARQLVEKLPSLEDKKFQEKGVTFEKSTKTSINKLLSNGFARQLLETTPRTKIIYIKCDPSKSDSAWKWLERWMVVTSSGVGQQHGQDFNHGNCRLEEIVNMTYSEPAKEISISVSSEISDLECAATKSVMADDGKNSSTIENVGNFEFPTSLVAPNNFFNSLPKNDMEKPEVRNGLLNTTMQDCTDMNMINKEGLDDKHLQPNLCLNNVLVDADKLEPGKDGSNNNTEGASSETLENEEKKSVVGSRKSCTPAFVAAQSKFEELSLTSTVVQSVNSAYTTAASNTKTESHNIQVNSLANGKEAISAEKIFPDVRVEAAVSECGTEISISSTLDSPDRSDMEGGAIVLEIGALEKENHAIVAVAENASDLSNSGGNARPGGGDLTTANSNASVDLVQVDQHLAEPTTSDVQYDLEGTVEQTRSPEGTPRSHATMPDLHGTPSSDVSVNTKKGRMDPCMPTRRKGSQLVGKKSPSNPNNDSGGSTTDNLTKDSRFPRRRNSFGLTKTESVEQEPRHSSSSSLPGYMQATASARAKAHCNTSQKSSPDLHDNQPKKRHSLPIENGKQSSSPRMQRSTSRAHQSVKGIEAHSPHDSAERRWQR
ncbi:protein IQ-DOMAIN 32-like [Musa acuminata AAA Group]|uniref:protein IQ-DOMAIN 32-like n=1 Tax=Musa acuminata AAA Group TaxID=214697 RepID=UPI0031D8F8B0